MYKPAIKSINGQDVISQDVIKNLEFNNTYCPDVDRVIFLLTTNEKNPALDDQGNPVKETVLDKTTGKPALDKFGNPILRNKIEVKHLTEPKLATTVYFTDGTKVTVQNTEHDKVIVKDVYLDKDGKQTSKENAVKTIQVADDCSKEVGLCYAILQRMCTPPNPEENYEITGNGLAKLMSSLLKSSADQNIISASVKIQKAASKARAEEAKKQPKKDKPKHYSYNDVAQLLGTVLERLATKLDLDPDELAKAAAEAASI